MELNVFTITYLFLRLSPFIIVCFFSLASIFNQDFKGLIYLIGLIISSFITITVGSPISKIINGMLNLNRGEEPVCRSLITLGNRTISELPLSQNIFGFTFFYLFYLFGMKKHTYIYQNIPTLVFFPLLILFDIVWNLSNNCYTYIDIILSLGMGIAFGIAWAALIDKTKMSNLQYFNRVSGNAECSRPAKSTFKCNVYKNGKLISSNMG
jgi:hypothetical protein